jgi:hypothetical protein
VTVGPDLNEANNQLSQGRVLLKHAIELGETACKAQSPQSEGLTNIGSLKVVFARWAEKCASVVRAVDSDDLLA